MFIVICSKVNAVFKNIDEFILNMEAPVKLTT